MINNILLCLYLFSLTDHGWMARVAPADHIIGQFEFDVVVGADGKKNTLGGTCNYKFYNHLE